MSNISSMYAGSWNVNELYIHSVVFSSEHIIWLNVRNQSTPGCETGVFADLPEEVIFFNMWDCSFLCN